MTAVFRTGPGPFPSGPSSMLRERPEWPVPEGDLPAGTAPVVAVAAVPAHPANTVLVLVRREGGPAQAVHARPDAPPVPPGEQWFRADLPVLEAGRTLDYRAELVRAGQVLATIPPDGGWIRVTGRPVAATGAPAPPMSATAPAWAAPPVWAPPWAAPPVWAAPTVSAPKATAGPGPAGSPRWDCDLEFFAAFTASGHLEVIGETPEGYRINFFVDDGRAVGPGLDAVIHPNGGDWICIRRDGVGALDIRATWETADGGVVFYRAEGVVDLGPDGYDRAAAGQLTGCPAFTATPTFATAHPAWQWLNRVQGVGVGRILMDECRVEYDVYFPQVRDWPGDGPG